MAEDKESNKEQCQSFYDELAQEEKDKEGDDVAEVDDNPSGKSLGQALDDAPNLSDTQTIHAGLFPKDLGDPITNKLMIARIFPDCFVSLNRILVKRKVRMCDRRKPLDVAGFLTESYVLTTVGIDGKGRIDDLELAGSAREADEIDKMSRGLG